MKVPFDRNWNFYGKNPDPVEEKRIIMRKKKSDITGLYRNNSQKYPSKHEIKVDSSLPINLLPTLALFRFGIIMILKEIYRE